jgi:F-type H+-transporting ATPase subunit delta
MSKDFVNQYAKALFEVAGDLQTKADYLNQLRVVDQSLGGASEISQFFKSTEITSDIKIKGLSKAMQSNGISKDVLSTLNLLIERNKISYLSKIVFAYQALNDEANGVVRGVVRSSHELDPSQRKAMVEKIESVLNKKVILDYVQDSKVIGGLKAQVGSYTFDDTFETHLKKMKDQINRREH